MMRPRATAAVLAVLVLSVLVQVACDQADNPLAPAATVVTVTATPSRIALSGETSRITVIGIKPDGNPVNPGTQFTLTTTNGVLRPAGSPCASSDTVTLVQADGSGQARAELCGDGEVGDAEVTAALTNVSGGGETGSASTTVRIGVSDTSQPSVEISANPSVVPVGGESLITLIGRAADGSPVGPDQRIRLIADLGTLRCSSTYACPGESRNPCTAVCTDSRGEAEATYIAGERSGTGEISAILGTGEPAMTQVDINAALDSLTLNSSRTSVPRNSAGETITFTAFLNDSLGTPLSGVLVRFTSDVGVFSAASVSSNSQGEATTTLTVTDIDLQGIPQDGTFRVTATATSEGETRSDFRDITVLGAP